MNQYFNFLFYFTCFRHEPARTGTNLFAKEVCGGERVSQGMTWNRLGNRRSTLYVSAYACLPVLSHPKRWRVPLSLALSMWPCASEREQAWRTSETNWYQVCTWCTTPQETLYKLLACDLYSFHIACIYTNPYQMLKIQNITLSACFE